MASEQAMRVAAPSEQLDLLHAGSGEQIDLLLIRIGCCITDPPGPARHLETALGTADVLSKATLEVGR